MFGLFTWFGSMVIALSYLVWVIVFPIMAAWFFLSVRRSLARIADSLEQTTTGSVKKAAGELQSTLPVVVQREQRIVNSLFGR